MANRLNSKNTNDNSDVAERDATRHSSISRDQVMVLTGFIVLTIVRRFNLVYLKVPLIQGHNLKIEKSDLKFAITIGRLSSGNLNQMVNKIMESIYTRLYMSQHSLFGMAPRLFTVQKDLNTPPKPKNSGLPKKDILAITRKLSTKQIPSYILRT